MLNSSCGEVDGERESSLVRWIGLDKLCRHNFENNRRLKELRIMLE